MLLFAHADFCAIKIYVAKNKYKRITNMRKIRKVIADSTISYYDRDGVAQTFHTIGNVRNVEMAMKALMDAGIVNVLVDDITVDKTVYVMDVDTFIEHAERVAVDVTGPNVDNDNGNGNEEIEL
ncbi:MAG: hypothetical protein [Bacteriophage sp.]|nr:MAG: hypothetical protein [Bacteriophage sp.]